MFNKKSNEAEQFVKTRINSFQAAFHGLAYVLKTQKNAWIHLTATIVVIALGFWLGISRLEWLAIFLVIGLVWLAEFLNTALESIVDLASPEIQRCGSCFGFDCCFYSYRYWLFGFYSRNLRKN